jgi:hypothetical protein
MRMQFERGRSGPGPLHGYVGDQIFDQLTNPRRAVDVGEDFQQVTGCHERLLTASRSSVLYLYAMVAVATRTPL